MFKAICSFFAPYTVIVEHFHDQHVVIHKATSYRDALDWSACYSNDCTVNINNWFGRRVAMVGQR